MDNVFVTEASDDITKKRIEDLYTKLSKYKWGCVVDGKDISSQENCWDKYITLTPRELDRYKCGSCWDYVTYEYEWFKKNAPNVEVSCYMLDLGDPNKGCSEDNHAWLTYKLPEDPLIYAMETSWKAHKGIHAFESVDDMLDVYGEWELEGGQGTYVILKYTPPKAGLSVMEFLNVAYRGEVVRSVGPYYKSVVIPTIRTMRNPVTESWLIKWRYLYKERYI